MQLVPRSPLILRKRKEERWGALNAERKDERLYNIKVGGKHKSQDSDGKWYNDNGAGGIKCFSTDSRWRQREGSDFINFSRIFSIQSRSF